MEYIVPFAFAYLLGTIPFGYVVGRLRNVDVREEGSKSTGATNILRILGLFWGLLVLLLDMGKGISAVMVAQAYGFSPILSAVVLFCAVLGHVFPVYLKFRGGKGVATLSGGLLVLVAWQAVVVATVVWFCWVAIQLKAKKFIMSRTNLIVLGIGIPIGLGLSMPPWGFLIGAIFSMLICWTHRENIKRLLRGEEEPLSNIKYL